ncbi:MAG: antibiotic biosynthesis monooxygenase [Kiritimatiellae bacterium]|nr:antibiotic biosynthesis monooxygenase [Kiritimatiellia bacterium]
MAKQIFRLIVHMAVVGTLAVMVLSLRSQLNEAKRALAEKSAAKEEGGVYVLCRFDLKPDADAADYAAKTLGVVPTVRAEKGCRLYTLLKDADTDWDKPMKFGERTMFMLEKWDSVEALKAHLETPHMKAFGPTVRDMRTSSTFHVLQEVK